jgi:polyvinyl alcohol dehydrogenase (cytochrome)
MWGTATDGNRIYVSEANSAKLPDTLPDATTFTSGSFSALDPATGKILWKVADPAGGTDSAPVSVANGDAYFGSMAGAMYALNAATGKILWTYKTPQAVDSSPAIVGGTLFWGDGYSRGALPEAAAGGELYAFSVAGQ